MISHGVAIASANEDFDIAAAFIVFGAIVGRQQNQRHNDTGRTNMIGLSNFNGKIELFAVLVELALVRMLGVAQAWLVMIYVSGSAADDGLHGIRTHFFPWSDDVF